MNVEQSVSVIIAAYNASATLKRAIDSIIEEDAVQQIIIVDDCSTDGSLNIANSYSNENKKISVLTTNVNSGPSLARNMALKLCKCEWIAILDADDFIDSGRFDKLLSQSEGYELIADDQYRVLEGDEDGIRSSMMGADINFPFDVDLSCFINSNINKEGKERQELGFIKPIIRQDFIKRHSLFFQENMRLGEDYEFYCRCLILGAKLKIIELSGYVAVIRENSLSGRHSKYDLIELRNCDYQLIKSPNLTSDEMALLKDHALSVDKKIQWICFYKSLKKIKLVDVFFAFFTSKQVAVYITEQLKKEFYKRFILGIYKS